MVAPSERIDRLPCRRSCPEGGRSTDRPGWDGGAPGAAASVERDRLLVRGVETDETARGQGAPEPGSRPSAVQAQTSGSVEGRPGVDLPGQVGPLQPGDPREAGSYTLLGRLGAGGMGTVYLGLSPDGRQVAVKMIRPELAEDDAFVERFRREVQAARRVAGFCTARVLDAGLDAPRPFLVTEYVDGLRLDHAVERDGPLSDSSLEAFAVGVAAALTAIHSAGLVHRDLKPSNVLLSRFGPRVIDFGIARALDTSSMLTRMSVVMGTPGWMAPEQLGDEPVTKAADVFAWGALVAYAASGRPPFGEGSLSAVAYRILHLQPSLDEVPGGLRRLVAASLEKDPAARPSSRALLLDLLGDNAPSDEGAAVTEALHRTWTPPPSATPDAPTPTESPDTPTVPDDQTPTVRVAAAGAATTAVAAAGADAAGGERTLADEEPTEQIRTSPQAAPARSRDTGRRLPAAGNPAAPDRRAGEKRTLPPAGRPFPEDRPRPPRPEPTTRAQPSRPTATPPAPPPAPPPATGWPAAQSHPWEPPPSRPLPFRTETSDTGIGRPPPARPAVSPWVSSWRQTGGERPPVAIPRVPPSQQRPAEVAPPRGGVFRRLRRGTAHLLALPAVIGGAVVFTEQIRAQAWETYQDAGTGVFWLLALAFIILPGSRQHRGLSRLFRLVGWLTIAAAVLIGARLQGQLGWDPLLTMDPFAPHGSLMEEYTMRLAGLFALLTMVFYGFPKDR
jgi:serine/threonine protein kinase